MIGKMMPDTPELKKRKEFLMKISEIHVAAIEESRVKIRSEIKKFLIDYEECKHDIIAEEILMNLHNGLCYFNMNIFLDFTGYHKVDETAKEKILKITTESILLEIDKYKKTKSMCLPGYVQFV